MLSYRVPAAATARAAWPLYARPDRWHEWRLHVRGAIRLLRRNLARVAAGE